MKKILLILTVAALLLTLFAGCANNADSETNDSNTIVVGASITPHAEILAVAKEVLEEQGIELEIVEFNDYVQPNLNVESGELDANYFQHQLSRQFNADNGTHIVSVALIHYEPFGIYAGKPIPKILLTVLPYRYQTMEQMRLER